MQDLKKLSRTSKTRYVYIVCWFVEDDEAMPQIESIAAVFSSLEDAHFLCDSMADDCCDYRPLRILKRSVT